MPAATPPVNPDLEQDDPAVSLTQKFRVLDAKLDRKRAAAEAQVDAANSAVTRFKRQCQRPDSSTKLNVRAFSKADLEEDDLEEKVEDLEERVEDLEDRLEDLEQHAD